MRSIDVAITLAIQLGLLSMFVPRIVALTVSQEAYLKASNTDAGDLLFSADISGDTLVVGAPDEDSSATVVNGNQSDNSAASAGAAYVFVRSGTNWSQQAYLKASNAEGGDRFGSVVAISGDTIVVGADQEDSEATGVNGNQSDNSASRSGAAYVFVRSGTTWSQEAYLKASNTDANDQFGTVAAIDGETLVAGAQFEDSNATGIGGNQSNNFGGASGAVYIFVRSGTMWSQQAYIKASNAQIGDRFGRTLDISGDTMVVSARFEDSSATGINGNQADNSVTDSGAVYAFVRSGTVWSQQAYIKASNPDVGDLFGDGLALDGNTFVVGTGREDSSATGINGNETDNSALNAGAAYLFTRSGTIWSQEAYIKASNTDPLDFFGIRVRVPISGDTIVITAPFEDSAATGVNGNEADNSKSFAGAAYVFRFSVPNTEPVAACKNITVELDSIGTAAIFQGMWMEVRLTRMLEIP